MYLASLRKYVYSESNCHVLTYLSFHFDHTIWQNISSNLHFGEMESIFCSASYIEAYLETERKLGLQSLFSGPVLIQTGSLPIINTY